MNERTRRAIEGLRSQQKRIESSLLMVATATGQLAETTREAAGDAKQAVGSAKQAVGSAKQAAEAAKQAAEAAKQAAEAAKQAAEAAQRTAEAAENSAERTSRVAEGLHSAFLTLKEETIRGHERTDGLIDAVSDIAHNSVDQEKWRRKADRKFEWMENWIREQGGTPPNEQEEAS